MVVPHLSLDFSSFAMRRPGVRIPPRPPHSKGLTSVWKAGDPRLGHRTSLPANQVIAAVQFTLGVPRWPRGAPRQFHSLVATAFFTWINFNSIAFCIVVLDVYDGYNQMKEKDDDIAHPGMVPKPTKHLILAQYR